MNTTPNKCDHNQFEGFTVRTAIVDDLCEHNNGICKFTCNESTGANPHIGGITFAYRPEPWGHSAAFNKSDEAVAQHTQDVLLPLLEKRVWVFMKTWRQPHSRITDYYKLWKCLEKQEHLDLAGFELGAEVEIMHDEEVCYAGLMELKSGNIPDAVKVLRKRNSFALLSNRDDIASVESVSALFERAYSEKAIFGADWQSLVEMVCPLGDVVLRVPPIMDIPPHHYESALDFFMPSSDVIRLRDSLSR